jgi:hypothetical protein
LAIFTGIFRSTKKYVNLTKIGPLRPEKAPQPANRFKPSYFAANSSNT